MKANILTIALAYVLSGCANSPASQVANVSDAVQSWFDSTQPYVLNTEEESALKLFNRFSFPGEFVENFENFKLRKERPLVVWTGIVIHRTEYELEGAVQEVLTLQHHYWDWRTPKDDSPIHVSPRGEGKFVCSFTDREMGPGHKQGLFVIAYGIPISYSEATGIINFECMRTRILSPQYYDTETFSYGPAYSVHNDLNDVQLLRDN